jgi:nucleotide-binding universal stress UspA family protein
VEPGHADDSHDSPEKPAPIASDRPLVNTDDEPRVVLAAVDTSPAAKPQATLHVLHVLRTSRLDRAQAAHAGVPGTSSEAMEDAKDHLEYHKRLAISQCRNTVIGHFTTGNPTGEILRFCSELKVDLLVIATHDHLGFERLLLGSIAETLVRKAPCSVTVVRQASHSTGS